jgi:hypothetical protein
MGRAAGRSIRRRQLRGAQDAGEKKEMKLGFQGSFASRFCLREEFGRPSDQNLR